MDQTGCSTAFLCMLCIHNIMSYPNEAGTQNAHLRYSLTDNSDLSLVNVFDKFVIESETNVLVLHLKDLFGSFFIL